MKIKKAWVPRSTQPKIDTRNNPPGKVKACTEIFFTSPTEFRFVYKIWILASSYAQGIERSILWGKKINLEGRAAQRKMFDWYKQQEIISWLTPLISSDGKWNVKQNEIWIEVKCEVIWERIPLILG